MNTKRQDRDQRKESRRVTRHPLYQILQARAKQDRNKLDGFIREVKSSEEYRKLERKLLDAQAEAKRANSAYDKAMEEADESRLNFAEVLGKVTAERDTLLSMRDRMDSMIAERNKKAEDPVDI